MTKIIIAAMAFLSVLFPLSSTGEPFKMPPFPEDESLTHHTYYEEGKLDPESMAPSQVRLHMEDPTLLKWHLYWVGQGPSRRPRADLVEEQYNGTTMNYTFYFEPGDKFILKGLDITVKDKSGEVVRRQKHDLIHPVWEHPDDVCHANTIHYALRGLDLASPGTEHSFNVWGGPEPGLAPMKAVIKDTETVTLKDGRQVKCYRVDVAPDLGKTMGFILGNAMRAFVGTYTFWFDVNGSHPLVKYEGPMGKMNSRSAPTMIYELVSEKPGNGE